MLVYLAIGLVWAFVALQMLESGRSDRPIEPKHRIITFLTNWLGWVVCLPIAIFCKLCGKHVVTDFFKKD